MKALSAELLLSALAVALSGCGLPSTKQTYAAGEQPSYGMVRLQTNPEDPNCFARASNTCLTLGTVLLTKPSDNLSMQFVRSIKKKANGLRDTGPPYRVITCISPAAAVTSIGAASGASLTAGKTDLGFTGAQSESALMIQSADASSHFLATASFYNCLNYAADMYDETTATVIEKAIIDGAVRLQSEDPKKNSTASDGFAVSGSVTGLTSKGLALWNYYSPSSPPEEVVVDPGDKNPTVFKFSKKVASGGIYAVVVEKSPKGQECHVASNSAGVASGDVANVAIVCK